ncbi:ENDO2 [Symbiodinium pilosum]|uniref:ENDO2 protein n=1 Tax=Symbiodinium pilosum TaxID=2952 RepID=A0A812K1B0_SYMPI|nr:ENDO2 [Symbiodinium pilosum]
MWSALAWLLSLASGFDIEAHDAVGQTCASAMDQEAIKQIKRMMGGQDASDVAGWGHQVHDTYPDTARLHFQVHDDAVGGFCGEKRASKCQDNICLLEAIKHFYGKVLSDEGRRIDYPAIDYNKVAKGIRFSDADFLKMLINLIGDLHQPMHVGYAQDDNGRSVKVKFRGSLMSLYEVWDKAISEAVRTEESNYWLGGWTHVRAVSSEWDFDKRKWKEDGAFKSFERWMDEAVQFSCKKAYVHPLTGQRLAGPEAQNAQTQTPVEIDEAAYQEWRHLWLRQILIAGERTAIVLNDILDNKGAARLATGSKVHTKADEEKAKEQAAWEQERLKRQREERRTRTSGSLINVGAFLTNLFVAIFTVPIFLLVANHGLNPQTYAGLIRSILESHTETATKGPAKRFE